jgi:hypothetical protein
MSCAVVIPGTDLTQVVEGGAALIVKVWAAEVPPPGLGLVTVTFALPAETKLLAGVVAVIWVALTHEDESVVPFHCTVAPFSKFEPESTKLRAAAPMGALEGAMPVRIGILWGGGGGGTLPPLPDPPQPASKETRRTLGGRSPCRVIAGPQEPNLPKRNSITRLAELVLGGVIRRRGRRSERGR